MQTTAARTKSFLKQFLITQCAVTLVALPITICWGLEFSLASPLGNLIFSPILTIFLTLSSAVFFTTLLGLPNGLLCCALEWTTKCWAWLLNAGTKSWMIQFAQPPFWILLGTSFISFYLLIYSKRGRAFSVLTRFMAITSINLLFLYGYTLWATTPQKHYHLMSNTKGSLLIICHKDRMLSLIDYGYFKGSQNPDKIVNYEIRPHLIKNFGTLKIKNFAITIPNKTSLEAALALCIIATTIQSITLPWFKAPLTKAGWRTFFNLKRKAFEQKIILKRTKKTA